MSPGVGAILGMLGNNAESMKAYKNAVGKFIQTINLDEKGDGHLNITFEDGTGIRIYDDGRSCCESRYMQTDDDLQAFVRAAFTGLRVQNAPDVETQGEIHEVQFLLVDTSKGTFTVATHNEHNGYYGGFWLKIEPVKYTKRTK